MAVHEPTATAQSHQTVLVDSFTDGLLGPDVPMLGPVRDGGHIVWNSTPGCWGPMITPAIRGGHEVCRPVAVEGAEVGDAIAIRIKDIAVTSVATASGNDQPMDGRFNGDPYCAAVCPGCGTEWPQTRLEGIGPTAVRCSACGADCTPFTFTNGYTIAFDEGRHVGVTLPPARAEELARDAARAAALPDNSVQNPILAFAPHDIVALATRLRPFLGQCGTSPSATIPDSHNAATSARSSSARRTATRSTPRSSSATRPTGTWTSTPCGRGRCWSARQGARRRGVPRRHARAAGRRRDRGPHRRRGGHGHAPGRGGQGAGIDGPVLFPLSEDLPFLARPLTAEERERALALARRHGMDAIEESLPVSVVGTGPDFNSATDNGLRRAAELLDMTVPEVANRATISGAIEIGRHPGVVQVTFRAPVDRLRPLGLLGYAVEQYGEEML